LVLPFSVEQNVSMASIERFTRFGFLRKSLEKVIGVKQVEALKVKTPNVKVAIKNLSGGNQQKVIVGRWLEIGPSIFIMDEPTKGIDVGAKYEIYVLMKEIAERGGAVILISSELPEVLNMSNRVLTICDGRITGEFNPEQESVDTIMRAALGLVGDAT
jgi:ribose transport system ATP-binding protein